MFEFIGSKLWALEESEFRALQARIEAVGPKMAADELAAAVGRSSPASAGGAPGECVAIVPIIGILMPRSSMFGTATALVGEAARQAAADPDVRAILLDVYSPGGMVYGLAEAAAEIRAARAVKPVVAVANPQAGSAGYWLAAQADELLVSPSSEVGAIGVFGTHVDASGLYEKMGVKVTIVSAGRFKAERSDTGPLGEEAEAALQADVDRVYGEFVADVAKGRKVSAATVRSDFGEGRMVGAKDAVARGMATAVGTFAEAFRRAERLGAERRRSTAALAQAQVTRGLLGRP